MLGIITNKEITLKPNRHKGKANFKRQKLLHLYENYGSKNSMFLYTKETKSILQGSLI
jgi:hypothetical protein